MTAGTIRPAAALLRRAADGYRSGEIAWGKDKYVDDDGGRCLIAAITWAADPDDVDAAGNPFFLRNHAARACAQSAVAIVAEHLTVELGWPWCIDDDGDFDIKETVGGWNDAHSEAEVVSLLDTVAEGVRPRSLAGAR